jgi:TorA maturation chaperone TorD
MHPTETTPHLEKLVAHYLAYSFLGKAFFEGPSIALMTTLKEDALFADWPLENSNDAMQTGLNILQSYCEMWDESDFPELKRDYDRLFIGPNKLPAPPWESVYRSEERLVFEEETLKVRAMYRQYGMALPPDNIQPDDHFGLEMMFVAHLCRLALDAIEQEKPGIAQSMEQAMITFFNEHICQWTDEFLENVQSSASTPYYLGLAALASGCIAHTVASWQINGEAVDAA